MERKQPTYKYTTTNKLKLMIESRRAEMTLKNGDKVLIKDVEKDLADYCGVSADFITAIKRGLSQPSLAVAIKIAQYFSINVEDIFELEGD